MNSTFFDQSKQFKRWTDYEESQLLEEVKNGIPIYSIPKSHDRSKKAIELRLLDMSIKMLRNGTSYEDILSKTGQSKEAIDERICQTENEQKNKYNTTTQPNISSINTINTIVREIGELRKEIIGLKGLISTKTP